MASAYNRADEVNWDRCLHQMALQSSVSQTDDKAIRTMFSVSCLAISYGIQWKSYRCYIPYVSYKARNFSRVANLCNDKSLTPAVENFLQVSQSNPSLPPSLWLPFWSPDPSSPHTSGCPQMPIWSQRPYLLPDRNIGKRKGLSKSHPGAVHSVGRCVGDTLKHLQWPCCPRRRWLWQTGPREQSRGHCPCRWRTASSVGCSSETSHWTHENYDTTPPTQKHWHHLYTQDSTVSQTVQSIQILENTAWS